MSESQSAAATSRTARLAAAGVSIWLDDLSRDRIVSGGLAELIAHRHVVGITTNPTIFARALQDGAAYDADAAALAASGSSADDAVLALTSADVAAAADLLRPVHDATGGLDGWVSIEVGAAVAHDAAATMAEVHRLVAAVDRPNVFIKIPATAAGIDAIREATAAGISVNVTLIFRLARYDQVVDAYLTGLERAAADGRDLGRIHSVASFFVSRVDTAMDARLAAVGTPEAERLRGRAGVANARLAYERFEQAFASDRARALLDRGATRQRPLWASTGVKDDRLRDTMYVEELIAPHVVNTMPEKTLQAFAEHGEVRGNTIAGTFEESRAVLDGIAAQGISYDEVTDDLERDGVEQFVTAGERLREAVAGKLTVRA